jgi:hypothetical protein
VESGQTVTATQGTRVWAFVASFLIVGYLVATRSFAYVGLPPLFVGEICLAAFLLLRSRASILLWTESLARPTPLSTVSGSLYLLLVYGVFQLIRGIFVLGFPPITAAQNFVLNYYPFYIFLGLWAARGQPDRLARIIRILAWMNGVYGIAYIAVLNRIEVLVPNTDVPLFGQPAGSAVVIVGLLCFEKRIWPVWFPLALNAAVLLGVQVRAEWLGLALGLLIWGLIAKQVRRVAIGATTIALLLIFGYVANISVPSPVSRGGEAGSVISARDIIGRAVAPFDEELASRYTETAELYAGTAEFRTIWWQAIWSSVHEDQGTTLIGHGYGYPLARLVPSLSNRTDIRTPHNIFFYALGYGGWLGVLVLAIFQGALVVLAWRANRATGQPFGLVLFVMSLGVALFSNFFESPLGAIPFYLLLGMSVAPFVWDETSGEPETELELRSALQASPATGMT